MNRLRVRFGRAAELKFISHLDLTRLWHRLLRRAGIELAYSEGFNPRPRLSLAVPLQIGVTSEAELMDLFTTKTTTPQDFSSAVQPQLPPGLAVFQVFRIPLTVPALQASVTHVDYKVAVLVPRGFNVASSITSILDSPSIPWRHQRDTGTKCYDLRPLITALRLAGYDNSLATLDMKLQCGPQGTGRPEQVVKAMGLPDPVSIHRIGLNIKTHHA